MLSPVCFVYAAFEMHKPSLNDFTWLDACDRKPKGYCVTILISNNHFHLPKTTLYGIIKYDIIVLRR